MKKESVFVKICFCALISAAGLLLLPIGSFAQNDKPLDLSALIVEAYQANPEILSAKNSFEAANARISQAASLSDPAIEFEYDKTIRNADGNPMKTIGVAQEIPFPTKLYFRAKVAAKLAKAAYEDYQAKELDVIARIKSAYAELALTEKMIEINKQDKELGGGFYKTATSRYASGKGTQADALKAQVEIARVDNELIMLEQKQIVARAKLNVLLGRDPQNDIKVTAPLPVKFTKPVGDFYALARKNNPELKAYSYALERGQAAYDLSLNEYLPDFMVKFKQEVAKGRSVSGSWAGMIGVTVPFWFFEKQAFGVKEMKADLNTLKAEYKGKENSVLFDVTESYARADADKKLIELYESAFIPQAESVFNAQIKGYETQASDFLSVVDSWRMLLSFKIDYYKAILDFRMALADLERAAGEGI